MSKQAGRMSQSANDFLAPYAPTIGTATDVGTARAFNNGAVSVTFTPTGPNAATSFTVTASTGQTATGASSPIVVTGIATGATPTFTVTGTNAAGVGPASAASNAATVTTVPAAPTIGTPTNTPSGRAFNNGLVSVAFTAGATGGKAITGYTALSSGGQTATGASSPISVTGLLSATGYTFQVKATNANGDSSYSTASSSVTVTTIPATPSAPTVTTTSVAPNNRPLGTLGAAQDTVSWSAPSNGGAAITNYFWSSSDGKSGNTGSTSVVVSQESGTGQTYTVRADNANGSATSGGTAITSAFSFTPFSVFSFSPFSVFGFSPFSVFSFSPFSVFGFSPFSVFGFSPFGFSPFGVFGFSPFGFSPFSPFSPTFSPSFFTAAV
jgi:hypothetical protein